MLDQDNNHNNKIGWKGKEEDAKESKILRV